MSVALELEPEPARTRHGLTLDGSTWQAVSAVAVAVVGPLIAWWIKNRQARGETRFVRGLEDVAKTMEQVTSFRDVGAERVILFKGHNGGGLPSGGSPFYVSAAHWWVAPGQLDIVSNYKNLLVDSEYVLMILDSISSSERTSVQVTATMPNCQLKHYYEAEGIAESLIITLGVKGRELYFLSIARYGGSFSDRERTIAQLKSQTLWQSINGVPEYSVRETNS